MKELLADAIDLAEAAGRITLEYYGKKVAIETKSDTSPVTIADRNAEEFLRAEIEKRYPQDGILGEEYGEKQGTSGIRWILDPVDGTKNFIRAVPLYGTLIGIEKDGRAAAGVLHIPPLKDTVSAFEGGGCFWNGERCRVSETPTLAEAAWMTTGLENFVKYWGKDALGRLIDRTALQRTWGDCYGYALVATGRADFMLDPVLSIWDVAPMVPIITEAGGTITDAKGQTGLGIKNGVASNGRFHAEILAALGGSN